MGRGRRRKFSASVGQHVISAGCGRTFAASRRCPSLLCPRQCIDAGARSRGALNQPGARGCLRAIDDKMQMRCRLQCEHWRTASSTKKDAEPSDLLMEHNAYPKGARRSVGRLLHWKVHRVVERQNREGVVDSVSARDGSRRLCTRLPPLSAGTAHRLRWSSMDMHARAVRAYTPLRVPQHLLTIPDISCSHGANPQTHGTSAFTWAAHISAYRSYIWLL